MSPISRQCMPKAVKCGVLTLLEGGKGVVRLHGRLRLVEGNAYRDDALAQESASKI